MELANLVHHAFFLMLALTVFFFTSVQSEALDRVVRPVSFAEIDGWADDAHDQALQVFSSSCNRIAPATGRSVSPEHPDRKAVWDRLCSRTRDLLNEVRSPLARARAGKDFFERFFQPYLVHSKSGKSGFFTGYYEPEVEGSLLSSADFSVPLYKRPDDLVPLHSKSDRAGLDKRLTAARRGGGRLLPYPTRREIESGALAGRDLELIWLRDRITAFFVHIQGSARIRLPDGRVLRLSFAAKNGHPYTAIGRVISQRYGIAPSSLTADMLRQWLRDHPDQADDVMWNNESFIFFELSDIADLRRGPLGAMGVPLTAMRSLAVDRNLYEMGVPVWVDALLPAPGRDDLVSFRRLMVAQDTGSAIVGAARGDIFFGSGDWAGQWAGMVRHSGDFIFFLPHCLPLPEWMRVSGE